MSTSDILVVLTDIRYELLAARDATAYQAAEACIILSELVEIQSAALQFQTGVNKRLITELEWRHKDPLTPADVATDASSMEGGVLSPRARAEDPPPPLDKECDTRGIDTAGGVEAETAASGVEPTEVGGPSLPEVLE